MSKSRHQTCVTRTENKIVTTRSGGLGPSARRDAPTQEWAARQYGVNRGQQVGPGRCLLNVPMAAEVERLSDDLRRGLLAHEDHPCRGSESVNVLRHLEPIHLREMDVEQNHVRPQCLDLLNGLEPIRRLDDLEFRPSQ